MHPWIRGVLINKHVPVIEVWHIHRFRTRWENLRRLPRVPISHAYVSYLEKTGELLRLWRHSEQTKEAFRHWITTTLLAPIPILSRCPAFLVTYKPLVVQMSRIVLVRAGWYYWARGWTSVSVHTTDGMYRIWSRVVAGTRPIVFFPGVGLGFVPYVSYLSHTGRTVYAIEVPNLSNLSWEQTVSIPRTRTVLQAFHTVVPEEVVVDIMGHSMGTFGVSLLVNGLPSPRIGAIVLFDPFCHPVHVLQTQRVLFAATQTGILSWIAHHMIGRDLEVQAFALFSRPEETTLWRTDYPPILNMWSGDDMFLDHTLLHVEGQTHHVVPGNHGSSIRLRHFHHVAAFLEENASTELHR